MALSLYAQSCDGHLPRKNNDFGALYRYCEGDVFYCPSDSQEHLWRFKTIKLPAPVGVYGEELRVPIQLSSSYVYKGGFTTEDRVDTLIAGESRAFHMDWVNVLYLGGHVKSVPAETYKPVVPPLPPPQPPGRPGGPPSAPTPESSAPPAPK